MNKLLMTCCAVALSAACSKEAKPPATAAAEAPAEGGGESDILQKHPEKDPARGSVRISDRIREACGIDESKAYFAFDSAKVSAEADQVLTKLAECFVSGPLSGETMALVGHADPRGDDEYNMVLGGRRADNVGAMLQDKGLGEDRITTSSRGEMEAAGTDEATWAEDRRVDVKVAE